MARAVHGEGHHGDAFVAVCTRRARVAQRALQPGDQFAAPAWHGIGGGQRRSCRGRGRRGRRGCGVWFRCGGGRRRLEMPASRQRAVVGPDARRGVGVKDVQPGARQGLAGWARGTGTADCGRGTMTGAGSGNTAGARSATASSGGGRRCHLRQGSSAKERAAGRLVVAPRTRRWCARVLEPPARAAGLASPRRVRARQLPGLRRQQQPCHPGMQRHHQRSRHRPSQGATLGRGGRPRVCRSWRAAGGLQPDQRDLQVAGAAQQVHHAPSARRKRTRLSARRKMRWSLSPPVAASSAGAKPDRAPPRIAERQRMVGLDRQEERLVRTRLRLRGRGRQVDRDIHRRQRRRDHEDDQQHQHHVDERRDVDLVRFVQIVVAVPQAASPWRYSAAAATRATAGAAARSRSRDTSRRTAADASATSAR